MADLLPFQPDPPEGMNVFDRRLVRARRDRWASVLADHDFLFREVADRLADRLGDVTRRFPLALDLGARSGIIAETLGPRGGIETLVQAELSPRLARAARRRGPVVVADEEALPFGDGRFDLVLSNLSLHWVNDLPGALIQIRRALKPDGLIRGSQRTLDYLYFFPEERPVGVQLFGSDPGVMAEAARFVSSRPAELRPDFIDLNIGCPVHKVVTREAGAALLCNLPLLETMVTSVVEASSLPVTAKTRCGWDNDHKNGVEVAQRLEQCGVAMIAIHGGPMIGHSCWGFVNSSWTSATCHRAAP